MLPRVALLLLAIPATACGARSDLDPLSALSPASTRDASLSTLPDALSAPGDAGVDRRSPADASLFSILDAAPTDAGACGFELTTPTPFSVVGTLSTAQTIGGDSPFILVECQGAADGTVYTFNAQYMLGDNALQLGMIQLGARATFANTTCPAKVRLDGGFTTPGEVPSLGEPVAMEFECTFLPDGSPVVQLTGGYLSARLTPH